MNFVIQPTSTNFLWTLCPVIRYQHSDQTTTISLTMSMTIYSHWPTETLFDFPVSDNVTYLDETYSRRQRICFSKYHNFLSLYNHSDFVKMHMHNAWLLGKTDLTISFTSDFFIQPKHLLVFCGTSKLSQICDNSDTNTFNYHSFCFLPHI